MKKASARWKKLLGLSLLVLSLALSGCEGDDGAQGPPGPPGLPGAAQPPATSVANESCPACHASDRLVDVAVMHSIAPASVLQTNITSVTFLLNGAPVTTINPATLLSTDIVQPVVNFTATLDGVPMVLNAPLVEGAPPRLSGNNVSAGLAKLIPAAVAGDSDAWQSYFNSTRNAGAVEEGQPEPAFASTVMADRERNGTLEQATDAGDNPIPGQFNFIFTNVNNIIAVAGQPTPPLTVTFEPTLTHRVALQFSSLPDFANPALDFRPDGGTPLATREIVVITSCNQCHDELRIHGSRVETAYCVVCHNSGDTTTNPAAAHYNLNPQSGNTIDFKVMIHKIHRSNDLPSVLAGTPYFFGNDDFSEIGYPQDIRHCDKCHDTGKGAEGGNWRTVPTMATCTSCHDDISFVDPPPAGQVLHTGGVQLDNAGCTLCHTPTAPGLSPIADRHAIFAETAAADFQFNIDTTRTAFDAGSRTLSIVFSVTNPNAGGAPYNILADAPFTQGSSSTLSILVGFPTNEYANTGSGSTPAQPMRINTLSAANTTANGDGTFTVTASIPAGIDSVTVAIEGHPAVTNPRTNAVERIPVTNVFANVNTGAVAVPRRQVVDLAKCNVCHANLSLHGNNRQGAIEVCIICHNPNATDINRRPAPETTLDLKKEESIDFKRMIHAIHGAAKRLDGIVVYGFGGTPHDFGVDSNTGDAVHYPAILNNCEKCHRPGTFVPPLDDEVLATTVDTGADLADPADDFNITRTAAVCSSCHDQATMIGHMELQGANFSIQQENIIQ